MVRKVHKYADGGKIVKDDLKPIKAKNVASPGVSGAIKDFVGAVTKAVGPRSITRRKATLDDQIEKAGG